MKRKIAIATALAFAVIGALMVVVYTRGADGRAMANSAPEVVWTAIDTIPAGTPLEEARKKGLIKETQIPRKALPAGALQEISSTNANLVALSTVASGEYLLSARFGDQPTGKSAITVPEGMVSISVELSDAARVGSFLTPGSRVTIYDTVTVKGVNGRDINSTSVLLDDVLVIGVGTQPLMGQDANAAESGSSSGGSVTITVAVSPKDSVRLVHGIQTGSIYAGLRGSDADIKRGEQVTDLTINQGGA